MMEKSILVVDSDPHTLKAITSQFSNKGFRVFAADDGSKALKILNIEKISLIILEPLIMGSSGEDICKSIRTKSNIPIIMLSAKTKESDLLEGLRIGADDYITKPFSIRVLYAKVLAVLRRAGNTSSYFNAIKSFNDGALVIDFDQKTIHRNLTSVSLTIGEFKLLTSLVKYPGKVFSRKELIYTAFGGKIRGSDRSIDTYIKNIRNKIEDDPKEPHYILTQYGYGYKFGGRCSQEKN